LTRKAVRALCRTFWAAGWSNLDIVHAMDHLPAAFGARAGILRAHGGLPGARLGVVLAPLGGATGCACRQKGAGGGRRGFASRGGGSPGGVDRALLAIHLG
jgi:hypothetical protein